MAVEIPSTPERALVVAAHPDDIEFMAGGTVARWTAEGAQVTFCLITDGASGSRDPNMTHERLVATRQEEQRAAAAALGVQEVIFLGYPDGRLQASLEVRFDIARVIRRTRPEVVIAQDPTTRYTNFYINHPDHIAAADATLAAIMPTANTLLAAPELLAEGLEPHDVKEVLLSNFSSGTTWVPLEEAHVLAKIAALREHHSQLDGWEMEPVVREWLGRAAEAAREQGLACDFAESFFRIVLRRPDRAAQPDDTEAATADAEAATAEAASVGVAADS
jgi:LmbE family N-acetylglucosaminyl deacetylase